MIIVFELGGLAIFVFLGCYAIAQISQTFRTYRAGRLGPLLMDITPEDLQDLKPRWPVNERRWPPPSRVDSDPMPRSIAAAYGRLANRATRRTTMTSQILGLMSGACLGALLPTLPHMLSSRDGLSLTSQSYWQLAGVVALIELSILVGDLARDLDEIARIYDAYVSNPDDAQTAITGRRWSWWAHLLRRL